MWERGMACKTVMVNLAVGGINKPRIAVAKQVAERLDARLIGVTASEISPPLYFADGDAGQRLIEASIVAIEAAFSTLEEEFYAAVGRDSCRAEWRCSRQMPTQYVAQEARAADVIVTGQSQNIVMSNAFASADASDLTMDAGRPLLIVPDSIDWIDFRTCLVAWKEAAESRRAIADAIPLLLLAKDVSVVQIVEGDTSSRAAQRHVQDVVAWLDCHGIPAASFVVEKKGDVGNQLEHIAADAGAGLVVAGAYGNSRLRQWVFGGVTRHFLQKSERCALLSR
jgi:nucleotide-binding universal stress UspA family protein